MSEIIEPVIAPAPDTTVHEANHFILSGNHTRILYSATTLTGEPQLTFITPNQTLSFLGDDIRTVDVPDLGTVVSVTLGFRVDVDFTTFSVLLPDVRVSDAGGPEPVSTAGVVTLHRTPFTTPESNLGQQDFYRFVGLTGSADYIVS
jgi:hypothetical protein